ncbi:MAG: helix-turn-helix domain-containing protein [Candidatus Orphnella occulta]|nr:helix-turn-helix domain-containing protein [Candidatus Orphnella occulta]MDP8297157.1 helix-turn-helix domain-containing protein [Candidatus Orphnella occulta]
MKIKRIDDTLLTTKDLAEYLKLNEKTVLKMAQTGQLPAFKIAKQWRFYRSAIDKYLHEQIVRF